MNQELKEQMRQYIAQEILRVPGNDITNDTPLVSSGLVDSFSLVDILQRLEDLTALKLPAGKVRPMDLDTIETMFALAVRVGKPR